MANWTFINGDFVKEENAVLHFRDLAIQRGYGVFDFLRVANSLPLFPDDHLDRFYLSATEMHLKMAIGKEELKVIVDTLLQKNGTTDCGIRLTLTGGYSADGYGLAEPNFLISQHSFQVPTEEQYNRGIKLMLHSHQRQLSHVKTIDYLMAIWLQPLLKKSGADDILYHQNEKVTECPRSNFFVVTHNGTLITPSANILKGITRKRILSLARDHFKIEERELSWEEIRQAREAFICSSTRKILPVRQINNHVFSGQCPVTDKLSALLSEWETRYASQFAQYSTQTVKEFPHRS